MNGLLAALVGGQGFTASKQPLEAERGFLNVLSEENKAELLLNSGEKSGKLRKIATNLLQAVLLPIRPLMRLLRFKRSINFKQKK